MSSTNTNRHFLIAFQLFVKSKIPGQAVPLKNYSTYFITSHLQNPTLDFAGFSKIFLSSFCRRALRRSTLTVRCCKITWFDKKIYRTLYCTFFNSDWKRSCHISSDFYVKVTEDNQYEESELISIWGVNFDHAKFKG